jgi:hypothetical protein
VGVRAGLDILKNRKISLATDGIRIPGLLPVYSDTSANEDNSSRNHIR